MFKVATVSALPVVSMDMDTTTAGIQNSIDVTMGSSFEVGVWVSDVESPGIDTFEFDVDFDSSIVSATSVVDGGFLNGPVIWFENDISAPDVNLRKGPLLPLHRLVLAFWVSSPLVPITLGQVCWI